MRPSASRVPVTLGRYRVVSTIGRGGMSVVYRGVDPESGDAVALKTVALTRTLNLDCFRREIHALTRMAHPGIVRIREQGVDDGLRWCAMDLVEGTPLRRLFSPSGREDATATAAAGPATATRRQEALRGPVLTRVLEVLRRLCEPLAFLHGEGIVHRDLKPENVVVTAGDMPVIVDFGLAARFGGEVSREDVNAEMHAELGTRGYMAPEQKRGELYDARVDIYAMGCMLYEALTGHLPISGKPPSAIVQGVDPALDALVMRLLAADPRERLGYADSLALALGEVLHTEAARPRPKPPTYLYRPILAGRGEAVAQLCKWIEGDSPGIAIVKGESGVGKTRLVMEVAREATRFDARVITAECLPVSGNATGAIHASPLHPLRPLLRTLADHARVGGPETVERIFGKRLRVLAAYEPELLDLATSAHPEPPELSPQGTRARLFADLADTLAAFAREVEGLLLVVDDLQWADELTLSFLVEQLERARESPLRIVGTYRSEASTALLDRLSAAARVVVEVRRLDDGAVTAMVSDMLAIPSPPEALLRFMRDHSEGNPFFVAEYLRAAVQHGWLRRDALGKWHVDGDAGTEQSLPLPKSVLDLVTQRLGGLSDAAMRILAASSVLGRDVEGTLLVEMLGLDEATELDGLEELLRSQVFEEHADDTLRFSHDKLREVAYGRLEEEERRSLHERAAHSLERARGEVPSSFGVLAHHLLQAGLDARATDYLEKAGEHALKTAAHGQARQFFEQALSLRVPDVEPLRRGRWTRRVAEAAFGQGDIDSSVERALEALGRSTGGLPTTTLGWVVLLGGGLVKQMLAWTVPSARRRASENERARSLEAALTAGHLASSYYFTGDALRMVAMLLVGVNLADRAGAPSAVVESLARLGYVAGVGGIHRAARYYFARASALTREEGRGGERALTLYLHSFYHLGLAEWTLCEAKGREALALLQECGDRQDAEIAQTIAAHAVYFSGRIADARHEYEQVLESARGRGNRQHEAWGLYLVGRSDLVHGHVDRATAALEEALALLSKIADRFSLVMCRGLLAQAYLAKGDLAAAGEVASVLDEQLNGAVVPLAPCVHGYAGAADVRLTIAERDASDGRARSAARASTKNLVRFARTFPMAESAAFRATARYDRLEGAKGRALKRLGKSVAAAKKHAMPYEEAISHVLLADIDASRARDHRANAERLFGALGARAEVERLVSES